MGGSYLSRRKMIFFWFPVALAVAISIEYAPRPCFPMLGTSGLTLVLNPDSIPRNLERTPGTRPNVLGAIGCSCQLRRRHQTTFPASLLPPA